MDQSPTKIETASRIKSEGHLPKGDATRASPIPHDRAPASTKMCDQVRHVALNFSAVCDRMCQMWLKRSNSRHDRRKGCHLVRIADGPSRGQRGRRAHHQDVSSPAHTALPRRRPSLVGAGIVIRRGCRPWGRRVDRVPAPRRNIALWRASRASPTLQSAPVQWLHRGAASPMLRTWRRPSVVLPPMRPPIGWRGQWHACRDPSAPHTPAHVAANAPPCARVAPSAALTATKLPLRRCPPTPNIARPPNRWAPTRPAKI